MLKTQFTPGPFLPGRATVPQLTGHLEFTDGHSVGVIGVEDPEGGLWPVALLFWPQGVMEKSPEAVADEIAANSRLLAAAPELYTALETHINCLEVHLESEKHRAQRSQFPDYEFINQLEANLKSARELRQKILGDN